MICDDIDKTCMNSFNKYVRYIKIIYELILLIFLLSKLILPKHNIHNLIEFNKHILFKNNLYII